MALDIELTALMPLVTFGNAIAQDAAGICSHRSGQYASKGESGRAMYAGTNLRQRILRHAIERRCVQFGKLTQHRPLDIEMRSQ